MTPVHQVFKGRKVLRPTKQRRSVLLKNIVHLPLHPKHIAIRVFLLTDSVNGVFNPLTEIVNGVLHPLTEVVSRVFNPLVSIRLQVFRRNAIAENQAQPRTDINGNQALLLTNAIESQALLRNEKGVRLASFQTTTRVHQAYHQTRISTAQTELQAYHHRDMIICTPKVDQGAPRIPLLWPEAEGAPLRPMRIEREGEEARVMEVVLADIHQMKKMVYKMLGLMPWIELIRGALNQRMLSKTFQEILV